MFYADADSQSRISKLNWKNSIKFLGFIQTLFVCITPMGTLFMFPTAYFFHQLPQYVSSIVDEPTQSTRILLSAFEAILFAIGMGFFWVSITLFCITYKNMGNCVVVLTQRLKTNTELPIRTAERICVLYQYCKILLGHLDSLFSCSILVQELAFLVSITLLLVGGFKMSGLLSIVLSFLFYGSAASFFLAAALEFHPLVTLNLNSARFLQYFHSRKDDSKFPSQIIKQLTILKVRPMKVHTITLNILFDYVIFIISFLMMLLET